MPHILVVDDHPLNRHFITTLLSYYGHQVTEAADGYEALDAVRRRRPDLIIADVAMPRMDGVALARALRADPALEAIPVVFYTASYRRDESHALAQAAGVAYVINKPSDPELVMETVQRALGNAEPVRPWSSARMREYVARLQTASIRMSAILELALELSGERDPDELLRIACRALRVVFGASAAVIAVHGGEHAADGELDPARLRGRIEPLVESEPLRATGASEPLVAAARAAMPDIESAMLLPMTSGANPYGWVLLAARNDAPFSVDDERLALAAVAQIRAAHQSLRAAGAERGELAADLYASHERLRALSARVLSVQEQERTRLARELHDDLGQLLTAIKLDIARVPPPHREELLPLVEATMDTVSRIVSELRPSRIGEMGLAVAVERKLAELERRTKIECTLTLPPQGLAIEGELATAVFRILEEALTNVARHAGATRVEVTIVQTRGELVLEVRDNGRGIRMHESSASEAYGVIGMRERAVVLGGSLDVRGEEGRGTVVTARFPLGIDPGDDRR